MSKGQNVNGVKAKIDYAVFADASLSRDQIKEWLKKDIQGVYVLLSEMLYSEEVIDSLVNVFYKRYEAHHAAKAAEPELPLNSNDAVR